MTESFLINKKLKFLTAWASSSSKRRSSREQSPSRGRSRSQRSPFTREMTALSARPWLQDKGKKYDAFCACWRGLNQIVFCCFFLFITAIPHIQMHQLSTTNLCFCPGVQALTWYRRQPGKVWWPRLCQTPYGYPAAWQWWAWNLPLSSPTGGRSPSSAPHTSWGALWRTLAPASADMKHMTSQSSFVNSLH